MQVQGLGPFKNKIALVQIKLRKTALWARTCYVCMEKKYIVKANFFFESKKKF